MSDHQRLARFWRWYTKPTMSLATTTLIGALIGGTDALHVNHHWPWPLALAAVLAAYFAMAFMQGFASRLVKLMHHR